MNLQANHVSFYEKYYKGSSYYRMMAGKVDKRMPPD